MKPIETIYKGWRFRSRLEARWAVYFDAVGLSYEYELQGFDLGGVWYLPDFWLPEVRCWAEAKPDAFTPFELEKVHRLVRDGGKPCLLLTGSPAVRPYDCVVPAYIDAEGVVQDDPPGSGVLRTDALVSTEYVHEHRLYESTGYSPAAFEEHARSGNYQDIVSAVEAARFARFDPPGRKG
jgi:hypothetical protein